MKPARPIKIDGEFLVGEDPERTIEGALDAEARGYDGYFSSDDAHDPFLPLAIAGRETSRIELGTAITVAFARTPMTVAYTANDMQLLTQGRFILGLGSQVRGHIVRRFSMRLLVGSTPAVMRLVGGRGWLGNPLWRERCSRP